MEEYEGWPQMRPSSVRDVLLKANISREFFCQMVRESRIPYPLKMGGKWIYPPLAFKYVLKTLREIPLPGEGGE